MNSLAFGWFISLVLQRFGSSAVKHRDKLLHDGFLSYQQQCCYQPQGNFHHDQSPHEFVCS